MIPQVEQLLKDLGIKQYIGTPRSTFCGQPYITLVSGGRKAECESAESAVSESDAVAAYCEQLQKFLSGELHTQMELQDEPTVKPYAVIVWRTEPQIESFERGYVLGKTRKEYHVYSRLIGLYAEDLQEKV